MVVGEVDGRVCGACHLQMSVAEYEEVASDTIPSASTAPRSCASEAISRSVRYWSARGLARRVPPAGDAPTPLVPEVGRRR